MAIPEAAVGAIIGELLKAVLEIKGKIDEYNDTLARIEKTLTQIEPIVKEIDNLKGKLDRQDEQTKVLWEEIKKGKKLIEDCKSEIGGCCSCFQKQQYHYLGKLQELDRSLSSFFNIVMQLHTLREVHKAQNMVGTVGQDVQEILRILRKDTSNSSADTGNKSPDPRRQANSNGKDGGASNSLTPSAPAVHSIPDKGKESPGSNGSDPPRKVAASPKKVAASPRYTSPSPVPQTSGSSLARPQPADDRHPDQTKRNGSTAHDVLPLPPSQPPKSPEIIKETKWNTPAQISPFQAIDSTWLQPHVPPESRQIGQAPDKMQDRDQCSELIQKFMDKNHTSNSAADASNKSPAVVPEISVTPVFDQRKQAPGEYRRANSKEKDDGGPSNFVTSSAPAVVRSTPAKGKESPGLNGSHPTGKVAAAPKEHSPSVPQTSGSAQPRPNLEDERHSGQTKRIDSTEHNVPPRRPFLPAPTSPEVVKEAKRNVPAQISTFQAMDSPWQQPHVPPEPRQVRQAPDKVKEVPRESAYSYFPDEKSKVAISPTVSDDSIKGAVSGKDSPSGRYSSHPVKTSKDGLSSSYGVGIRPRSPEMKGIC